MVPDESTGDEPQAGEPDEAPEVEDAEAAPEAAERLVGEPEEARALRDELDAVRAELEAERAAREAAEKQAGEHLDRLRRTLADFDNYRKRTRQDAEVARERAAEDVLRELLQVLDNFDRALEHAGDEEALYDGVKLIYRQLRALMEGRGLRRVDAEGHAFDPMLHEAVMREPTGAYKEGVVIKELEKGYYIGERLLRPAKVKVAVAPPPSPEGESPDEGAGEDEPADAP